MSEDVILRLLREERDLPVRRRRVISPDRDLIWKRRAIVLLILNIIVGTIAIIAEVTP